MNYKKTLNLPATDFPMKANLPNREPEMIKRWDKQEIYHKIEQLHENNEKFILHDGPPYANGNIHLGTALNKILKDMVVKSKNMQGFSSAYIPGWDCHGLPIEHQIDKELGKSKADLSAVDFRRKCRDYAAKFIDIQRSDFKRLGVLGQWENPYITMTNGYESTIAREFGKVVATGGVYKGRKPVYWCASCVTALAEAEVEYDDHTADSIYVRFPMTSDLSAKIPEARGKKVFAVIWTTTPWTIPANLALAFHPEFDYVLVDVGDDTAFIMAEMLMPICMDIFGIADYKKLTTFKGQVMEGEKAHHPFLDRESICVTADYVTLESGTGVVHTAPGHGQDDYQTGLRYGLEAYAPVDDHGKFTPEVEFFAGQFVFKANKEVNAKLEEVGNLLHAGKEKHQYPHCWRCKQPIIFRSTAQWFLSMEKADLRKKALENIEKVQWIPHWGRQRILSMMENRPDWCLSRQRAWGIPIVAFYCADCEELLLDADVIDHVADEFEKHSSDVWFEKQAGDLLPAGTKCAKCGGARFEKETDILDVWFDSGVSHAAVCEPNPRLGWPVDLYLEGSDQHRGWFNSSLLTGVATRGIAPFKTVLTHGFVVDGDGRKMSKSMGNVIAPSKIISQYGAEILRLWVASEDYRDDIRVSNQIISRLVESYRRIRNTCRFLLGNISDFNPSKDRVSYDKLPELDRWVLAKMEALTRRVIRAYNEYDFHIAFHGLHNFCAVELSSFYLDVCKDRLYASAPDDFTRRAAQTAMADIAMCLARLLAPICTFTAEEVWDYLPDFDGKAESIHMESFPEVDDTKMDPELLDKWGAFLILRKEINKAMEEARREKVIGHSLDASVKITAESETLQVLNTFAPMLKELLIVSDVELVLNLDDSAFKSENVPGLKVAVTRSTYEKCGRCWGFFPEVGTLENKEVCSRCADALEIVGMPEE